jgi:hypothetical protein
VSSDDDLVAKELRDLQEARAAVGFFSVLEQKSANATDESETNLGPMRNAVVSKLEKAAALLGEGSDSLEMIKYLGLVFSTADRINYQLLQENMMYIALVSQALKDRFNLGSAGGPGGHNFSIAEHPHVRWRTGLTE